MVISIDKTGVRAFVKTFLLLAVFFISGRQCAWAADSSWDGKWSCTGSRESMACSIPNYVISTGARFRAAGGDSCAGKQGTNHYLDYVQDGQKLYRDNHLVGEIGSKSVKINDSYFSVSFERLAELEFSYRVNIDGVDAANFICKRISQ